MKNTEWHKKFSTKELLEIMLNKLQDGYNVDEISNLIINSTSQEILFDKYEIYPDLKAYENTYK